ncbi:MAG TPA: MOSC domain-containing protein [Candidatus Methylomirabilis sp.]|nr:MOSC domain-containing protein [Candidatus Methylomirabilis sp.]
MARVISLFRAPKRGWPMEELAEAHVLRDVGFEGCAHARPASQRQVLLVDRETLDALELRPGIIRENITTEGLNVNGLHVGESLRVGEALLEVTMPCTPCGRMEEIRVGLRKEIRGRRGMLCRVVEGGVIRLGDGIEKLANSSSLKGSDLASSGE